MTSITDTAKTLGIGRTALGRKLRELGWVDQCGTGATTYAMKNGFAKSQITWIRVARGPEGQSAVCSAQITDKGLEELRRVFA